MLVFGLEVGGLVLRFVFELDSLAFLEFWTIGVFVFGILLERVEFGLFFGRSFWLG